MTLFEKISVDMKAAMKAGDKSRVEVLRFTLAGLQNVQKEKNMKEPGVALTDEEAVALMRKESKRRKDAVVLFAQGKRDDLVAKETADLAVIAEYLPEELSEAEIAKVVDDVRAQGFLDFPTIMREAMKVLKGKADGKIVGEVIKKKLRN
jgi:uncharacterized protein YqeY